MAQNNDTNVNVNNQVFPNEKSDERKEINVEKANLSPSNLVI
jgi:hypothetical protein